MVIAGGGRKRLAREVKGARVMEAPIIENRVPPRSCAHCEFHAEHFSTCCRVLRDLAGPGSGDVPQAAGGKGAGGGRRGGCYRRRPPRGQYSRRAPSPPPLHTPTKTAPTNTALHITPHPAPTHTPHTLR